MLAQQQFQGTNWLLLVPNATGVPYMDVCDDTAYSQRAKALHQRAADAGVPAITTTGIYPGACCLLLLATIAAAAAVGTCRVRCCSCAAAVHALAVLLLLKRSDRSGRHGANPSCARLPAALRPCNPLCPLASPFWL